MKKLLLLVSLLMSMFFSKAQNCPADTDSCYLNLDISNGWDSCSLQQTLNTYMTQYHISRICSANIPSAWAQVGPNYFVTADINSPPGMLTSINSQSIHSVYFSLTGGGSYGHGDDDQVWLKSPAGTVKMLSGNRPFNSSGNTCYCPTFIHPGNINIETSNVPYNRCDYIPDAGALGTLFTGENPYANSGTWTLYLNRSNNYESDSVRIVDFCMEFSLPLNFSPSTSYTWTSDSAGCLAYLSSINASFPTFTPPAGSYDCTYYFDVYDSASGCSGRDTIRFFCDNSVSVQSLDKFGNDFHVTVHNSEITFTYAASNVKKEIGIYDIGGRDIARYELPLHSTSKNAILPAGKGIYFVKVSDGEKVFTRKLVIQ